MTEMLVIMTPEEWANDLKERLISATAELTKIPAEELRETWEWLEEIDSSEEMVHFLNICFGASCQ